MPYCYVDDHFPDHPKVLRAGGDAGWLWLCAYAWIQRNLTGGRIPKAAVPKLSDRKAPMRLAARLVEVGLWEEDGDDYVMHDYTERNPTAERARTHRASQKDRSAAGRIAANARWHPDDANACESHEQSHTESHESHSSNDANRMAGGARAQAHASPPARVSPLPHSPPNKSSSQHLGVAPDAAEEEEFPEIETALGLVARRRHDRRSEPIPPGFRRKRWLEEAARNAYLDHDNDLQLWAAEGLTAEQMADRIEPVVSPHPKPFPKRDLPERDPSTNAAGLATVRQVASGWCREQFPGEPSEPPEVVSWEEVTPDGASLMADER